MKNIMSFALAIGALVTMAVPAGGADSALPRSTPEAQQVSSAALADLVCALDEQIEGMHSLMVMRHGYVVAEGWWKPYDAQYNHVLYSLSKSFTSTAVGFAVAEGKLSIDDRVIDFFPDDVPSNPDGNLQAMRVRDLLTMATGHQEEPSSAPDVISARTFLAHPVPHLPGTHFKYNTAATFMQSAIVQQVTGETVLDYLRPRLFEPLGIANPVWDANFQGITLGGYGLRVRTEDIARFGQLYLQQGVWQGRQILPAAWVDMATARQVSNGSDPRSDWNQGYGFQFWRCRHHAFRGDGAFGQYCVVLPVQDAVVAITSGTGNMQAVLDILWDRLLPAFASAALPADPVAWDRLQEKLASLEVPPAEGAPTSPTAAQVLNRHYSFPENDQQVTSAVLTSTDNGETVTLAIERAGETVTFPAGFHRWRPGRAYVPGMQLARLAEEPVAGTFAWTADDTLVIKACAYETPFHVTFTLKFADKTVTLDTQMNVAFGPTRQPTLVGTAQSE